MTPEKQRIAIAEACGWKVGPTHAKCGWKLYCGEIATSFWWNSDNSPTLEQVSHALPDYLNDLNAMHEAVETLRKRDDDFWFMFGKHLQEICGSFMNCINATAAPRAEAFLRTIGEWEEE